MYALNNPTIIEDESVRYTIQNVPPNIKMFDYKKFLNRKLKNQDEK